MLNVWLIRILKMWIQSCGTSCLIQEVVCAAVAVVGAAVLGAAVVVVSAPVLSVAVDVVGATVLCVTIV